VTRGGVNEGLRRGDILVFHPSMEGLECAVYRYLPIDPTRLYEMIKRGDVVSLNGDQRLPTFRRLHKEATAGVTPLQRTANRHLRLIRGGLPGSIPRKPRRRL